jgi:osmotically-inducible protein OsmY
MNLSRTLLAAALAAATLIALPACTTDGSNRSVVQTTDDAALSTRVKTALIQSPDVKARDVNVDVRNGVVQLKGVVDNESQMRAAESIARNMSGVRSVQNDLRVATR